MNIPSSIELHFECQYQKGKKKYLPNTGQWVIAVIRQHIQIAEWYDIIEEIIDDIVYPGFFVEYQFLTESPGYTQNNIVQIRQ